MHGKKDVFNHATPDPYGIKESIPPWNGFFDDEYAHGGLGVTLRVTWEIFASLKLLSLTFARNKKRCQQASSF
jgi:hypothetical protein